MMERTSTRGVRPLLLCLLGPTGVGKTALSLRLASELGAEIVSADSRQIYREIPIGTAAPSATERAAVPHHFVGVRSVTEYYSASDYAREALACLDVLFLKNPIQLLTGGSMMYLDAVCRGLDELPAISSEVRAEVWERYASEGLEPIRAELETIDPDYLQRVDAGNYKRLLHAYEVYLQTGRPFSSFHRGQAQARPFDVLYIGLDREREDLYSRIDQRVHLMMEAGLEAEARAVYPYRELNALNTVGYKELFAYFNGDVPLDEAVRLIQRNSRHYARKQLSWWRRDDAIQWFPAQDEDFILRSIESEITTRNN